jgi:hypothetical protein
MFSVVKIQRGCFSQSIKLLALDNMAQDVSYQEVDSYIDLRKNYMKRVSFSKGDVLTLPNISKSHMFEIDDRLSLDSLISLYNKYHISSLPDQTREV